VEEVEQYLDLVGGEAKLQALKTAIRGINRQFLILNFDVTTDDIVRSKQGFKRQDRNIREYLTSKGASVPLSAVMKTFGVPKNWLTSHEEFLVQDGRIRLRIRQTAQPKVEIVEDHVGELISLRPSSSASAGEEKRRLRIFLMSKVARLPMSVRNSALRRLKGMWHPDVVTSQYVGHEAVVSEVFRFICSIKVVSGGFQIP